MKKLHTLFTSLFIAAFMAASLGLKAETIISTQDGNWNDGATWVDGIVPSSADSVVVNHLVAINTGDSCMNLNVAATGTIQNLAGNHRTLVILGNLWVDGEVKYTNHYFKIILGGNLHLNGLWADVRLYFTGTSEQIVSAGTDKIFDATSTGVVFQDEDSASPVKFSTDLTFISTELIGNGSTVEFAPDIEVTFDAYPIRSINIIGNNSTLTMQNGAFIEYSSFHNLIFDGVVNLGNDNSSTGELINTGTMQNLVSGYRTLTVNGNFTNNGIVTKASSYILHLIFFGDVTNNGAWTSGNNFFDGTVAQHIVSSPGSYMYCNSFEDRDVNSNIILEGDLKIRNAVINLNYATMDANGYKITLRDGAYFENSIINEASLGGRFRCYYNCEFTGTTTIVDTLENRPVSSFYPLTVQGDLVNNGVIRRSNSYAYKLFIHGDFEVNGPVDLEDLTFAGANDQTIYSTSKGGVLDVDQVYDTDAASAIIFNSDLTFIDSHWDLGGATINLANGAFLMQGGNLKNGSLIANNQYLRQRAGAEILSMNLSNVELRGVCQIDDHYSIFTNVTNTDTLRNDPDFNQQARLSTYGTFTNNGVINRSDTYGIRLFVHDDFVNNGPIDMEDLVFAGIDDQTIYSTSKGGVIDVDQVSDTIAESDIIFDSDMTFFGSSWDLDSATIILNNGALIMQGGNLANGFLATNDKYLRQSASAKISNMHFSNIELKGICLLGSTENFFTDVTVTDTLMNHPSFNHTAYLYTYGDIVNNGVITNSDAYKIDMRVDDNFYNNGKANFTKLVFTGDDIQHFSSPLFPVTDSPIESTKTGGLIHCDDDILLSSCTVDMDWDVFSLQNSDFKVTGGILQNVVIEGNGNKVISDGNGGTGNVVFEDLSIEGYLFMGGTNISFDDVTLTGTISQRPSHNLDSKITTTGDFINNGHILDVDNYRFFFYINDIVINNGEWATEKLVFEGDDMHFIESLGANPFQVDNITMGAKGGDVTITNELYLLNTNVNLSDQNLYIPDAGILDLDNSSIQSTMVYGGDFSTINASNNSWLSASTFNNIIISGEIDTRANTFVDCVLDALMQNDNSGSNSTIAFEGVFTNNGSMINRPSYAYELFTNVFGHVYNYGSWEIDKNNWQGLLDQDIYLLDNSEINTLSEFYAMVGTSTFQWYKNNEMIDGETTNRLDFANITVTDRGYYHCTTNEGTSRTIRICTPVEIDLINEAYFCQYESVMIEATPTSGEGPYTYLWEPAEGLSDPTIANPIANPATPTEYTVTITDAIGCKGQASIFVQQYPQLYVDAGADDEICFGDFIFLAGSATGGDLDYTYLWSPDNGLSNPSLPNPSASPQETTTYTLTVTDGNGCVESDQITLTVNPLPIAYQLTLGGHFCEGVEAAIVGVEDSEVGIDYYLLRDNLFTGEILAGTGSFLEFFTIPIEGVYTVKGINTITDCENLMTGSIPVEIDYAPVIIDQSGEDHRLIGTSKSFYVNVTGTSPLNFDWYFEGDLVQSGTSNTYIKYNLTLDDTGNYWCIVENNCGEMESEPMYLTVLDEQSVVLPQGWSGISTYLNIWDDEVDKIFQYITEELIIVNDFEHMFWPGQNINTYEDGLWDTYTGAQIKLSAAATVDFQGLHLENKVVDLTDDWTYLPILHPTAVPADEVFMQNPGTILFAKDIAGTGVFWPEYNINTLDMLSPGLAYLVKVAEPTSIDFGIFYKSETVPSATRQPDNTTPWNNPVYSNASHTIALPEPVATSTLMPGDWIGVFNAEGMCCGIIEYTGMSTAIPAFGDDITTYETDGLLEAEWMMLKSYRPATHEVFDLEVTYDASAAETGYFAINGMSVISGLKAEATGIGDHSQAQIGIYPNPTHGVLYFEGIPSGSKIEICDVTGQLIFSTKYNNELQFDLSSHAKGLYSIRVTYEEFTTIRKVMVE